MLVLSSITALLNQLLSPPNLHTAVLLTPQGQLVAYATTPPMSEDRVRLVVGLGGEVWKEIVESEEEEDLGMVDSEVGRVFVLPIYASAAQVENGSPVDSRSPAPPLLVALHGTRDVPWGLLRLKAKTFADYVQGPIATVGQRLTDDSSPPLPRAIGPLGRAR